MQTIILVHFSLQWYNISVQAYDRGVQPKVSEEVVIHIKTGDNPPEFSKNVYEFQVSENSQAGEI